MTLAHTWLTLVPLKADDSRFQEILDEFERRTDRKSQPGEMRGRTYLVVGHTVARDGFNAEFGPVLVEIEPAQADHIGIYEPHP